MNNKVTTIMYHYVRNITESRYPAINGIEVDDFRGQIGFLKKHYNFITMEQLIDSIHSDYVLPPKAVLLTFDDAYTDHFMHVFPILVENEIQGSFFIPAKTVLDHKLLDVNKIHFILSSCRDKNVLVKEILDWVEKTRNLYNLKSNDYYLNKSFISNRYDSKEVVFVKRMLQVELNEALRATIVDDLFCKYVGISESIFAKELYLSIDQIKTMLRFGMHIGAHGYDHYWLGSLSSKKQYQEIGSSFEFLKNLGVREEYMTMCYPYGSYNQDTIDILTESNCKLAFTTEVRVANIHTDSKFTLPRLDTNDFPFERNAALNNWFDKI